MKQSGGGRGENAPKSSIKSSRRTTNKSRHRSSKANAASSNKTTVDTISTSSASGITTSSKTTDSKANAGNSKGSNAKNASGSGTTGVLPPDILAAGPSLTITNDPMTATSSGTTHSTFTTSMDGAHGLPVINKREENPTMPTKCNQDHNISVNAKNQGRCYAGLDARSIRTIWEQHDQSDVELSTEVCARVAEDVSYKLWELISNIKIYARHSGGMVTYDLVNEVLKDADVPPCLGALDSDWERIDYDGTFYYYSDKILELRDEYQREISFDRPMEKDFRCLWPIEEKQLEYLKEYVPNMIYVLLNGEEDDVDVILAEAFSSPFIGCTYRLILNKLIQILAFRQSVEISQRCWRLLRALARNPQSRDVDCRLEYFHLSEILVCQLLAPYESIKISCESNVNIKDNDVKSMKLSENEVKSEYETHLGGVKMEPDLMDTMNDDQHQQPQNPDSSHLYENNNHHNWSDDVNKEEEKIFKLLSDDETETQNPSNKHFDPFDWSRMEPPLPPPTKLSADGYELSGYFATPVDMESIGELCDTLGSLAFLNGYIHNECIHHINKRLKRFFESRHLQTERDFQYLSRAIRGLIALGGYAFCTFIPFIYELNTSNIPETLWTDFALAGVFLRNQDDEYLYEWLEFVCGGDKLQPYLTYYANYYEKLLCHRYRNRKQATYYVAPKLSVRRLEWSTLVADMCHGDDPNKPVRPKPTLKEAFPELTTPRIHTGQYELNREIHFRFAGCRPVNIRKKVEPRKTNHDDSKESSENLDADGNLSKNEENLPNDNMNTGISQQQLPLITSLSSLSATSQQQQQHDIIIARRRLLKPLSNEKRFKNSSNYYYIQI